MLGYIQPKYRLAWIVFIKPGAVVVGPEKGVTFLFPTQQLDALEFAQVMFTEARTFEYLVMNVLAKYPEWQDYEAKYYVGPAPISFVTCRFI
jgi:hypothetical protein